MFSCQLLYCSCNLIAFGINVSLLFMASSLIYFAITVRAVTTNGYATTAARLYIKFQVGNVKTALGYYWHCGFRPSSYDVSRPKTVVWVCTSAYANSTRWVFVTRLTVNTVFLLNRSSVAVTERKTSYTQRSFVRDGIGLIHTRICFYMYKMTKVTN